VKTAITLAILIGLALLVTGGVAVSVLLPKWVCLLYGFVASVAVWDALEAVRAVWTAARPTQPTPPELYPTLGSCPRCRGVERYVPILGRHVCTKCSALPVDESPVFRLMDPHADPATWFTCPECSRDLYLVDGDWICANCPLAYVPTGKDLDPALLEIEDVDSGEWRPESF
jgi:hypothetical protein